LVIPQASEKNEGRSRERPSPDHIRRLAAGSWKPEAGSSLRT
jgi:hypothetical protein